MTSWAEDRCRKEAITFKNLALKFWIQLKKHNKLPNSISSLLQNMSEFHIQRNLQLLENNYEMNILNYRLTVYAQELLENPQTF
jgi:hypothetical protein